MTSANRDSQAGFTYLALLVVIAVLGVGLVAASEVWQTTAQRQKLAQLQWAASQYVTAIASYVETTPGFTKTYPASLDELIEDRRSANVHRHLRTKYRNPVATDGQWQLVTSSDGRIHGVKAAIPWANGGLPIEWTYVRAPSS